MLDLFFLSQVRPRNAAEQGFRPHITAKARLRRAHTIDELYEGGRARRHRALVRAFATWSDSLRCAQRSAIVNVVHANLPLD